MSSTQQQIRLLVTGGSGFIGSAVCHYFVSNGHRVCNVDKLTYAANPDSLRMLEALPNYRFEQIDICNLAELREVVFDFAPDAIMHLAAESHVDRSISGPSVFVETNVVGSVNMLEVATAFWTKQGKPSTFRFHHVSTDEVYGDLPFDGGRFSETTPYNPSSPYSASKAASDFMAGAWCRTYGLPVIVSNCSNNYGPRQHPEKLIPNMIVKALAGEPLPVYGTGSNVRDWLHVEDHVTALHRVLQSGRVGNHYNIGGDAERSNIDVVTLICSLLDEHMPLDAGRSFTQQITFVKDRAGHDLRYAIDPTKVRRELGWTPSRSFERGLAETVDWYLANTSWWKA